MEQVKLDKKDKQLLYELELNARMPLSQLAKKLRLSKQTAGNRLRRLIEKGVIQSSFATLDWPALGYMHCRLFFKFRNLTREKEAKLLEITALEPRYKRIIRYRGEFDLQISAWVKTIYELKDVLNEFKSDFGGYIQSYRESILVKLIYLKPRYILEGEGKPLIIDASSPKAEVDELDLKILEALSKDGRVPMVKIGELCNCSTKVAAYRIKKMEKSDLIKGYRLKINYRQLGYSSYKVFLYLSDSRRDTIDRLISYLSNLSEVSYIAEEVGICDLNVQIMVRDQQDVFNFIDKISENFPGVLDRYKNALVVGVIKNEYNPFLSG